MAQSLSAKKTLSLQEKDLRKKIYGYEALNNTERARLWKVHWRVNDGPLRTSLVSEQISSIIKYCM